MITTINEFRNINENVDPTELNWDQYCEQIFGATASEVELALSKDDFSSEEIEGFKACTYYLFESVYSPDINDNAYDELLNKEFNVPGITMMHDAEPFFTKDGTYVYHAIGYKGDNPLEPYSINF